MNKTIKRNVLVSAILAIMLCVSLIAGATFALFTSESKVNIAVTSGKVSVVANIDETSVQTKQLYDTQYKDGKGNMFMGEDVATFTATGLELNNVVPGDGIKFNIVVKNESNVTVKYRTIISCENDNGLFAGLNITVGDNVNYSGVTLVSDWAQLAVGSADEIVPVTIELPEGAGNEYQEKTCDISYKVEAVQGNTEVMQPEANVTYLYNASDLRLFEKSVNSGNSYVGKTVKLMDDVDLAGIEWKPVGQTTGYSAATYFQGTFDGNGKTISNLTIGESSWEEGSNDGQNFATGFFGFIDMGSTTIKNVTFDKANVEGHHWVGVVAGYMTGTVSDVTVTNSTVTSSYKTSQADGDKAGGIVGYLNQGSITGCTVSNSTVTAVRDNGSVVGYSTASGSVTGNTAENCTVYYSTDNSAQIGGEIAGKRAQGVSDNTANNVTIAQAICTAEQLSAALNATYNSDTIIKLINDITLSGEWGAHTLNATNSAALIIDGNGKTINGLTSTNYYKVNGFNSNGLVTSIGAGFSSVTFKNLTVSGAKLENKGGDYAASGVFVGDTNTVNVTFDSCTVIGAKINSDKYAGGFIGYAQDVNDTKKTIKFTNCVVIDSEINTTDSSVGGLVGHNYTELSISGCQIKGNTTIKCAEDRTGSVAKAGYLIGTVNGGSATISNITVESTVALDTMDGTTYDTTRYVGRNYGTVSVVTANS